MPQAIVLNGSPRMEGNTAKVLAWFEDPADAIDVASLIHERVGLAQADVALAKAGERGVLKVLVEADTP